MAGPTEILGIDIGGSGMKAAPVDVSTGDMLADRFRITTPRPAEPEAMAAVVGELATHFDWSGPIGITFPGVVQNNVIRSAANVSDVWVGVDGAALFGAATGCDVRMVNDADAAGVAEARFGAARYETGVSLLLTFGTGIGSALINGNDLIPNTELGHLPMGDTTGEELASSRAKDRDDLSFETWAGLVTDYLRLLECLLWPDVFIFGGGISRNFDEYGHLLDVRTPVRPAEMRNNAGIVGAALHRADG